MITFDDGYRDNFEVALPILSRYGAPATFFIPTLYLDSPGVPWWDVVAYIIKNTVVPTFTVDRAAKDPDPIVITLGANPSDLDRTEAITSIIASFLTSEIADESRFLAQLARQAQISPDRDLLGRGLFMGWNEVRQLVGAGMSVGSHGQNHRALARLDVNGQRQELEGSKRRLEAALDGEVTAIAYPFGWQGTFTAQTLELARDAGYRWGFSSLEGINSRTALKREALALRRLNIGTGDSALLLRARLGLYGSTSRSFI
jgi:peptidoglycan/xylan/chitin deacetylase (PgdA/CDA1 family)